MAVYRTRNGDLNLNSIKSSIAEILPNKSAESIERTKFEQSQVLDEFLEFILEINLENKQR